MPNLQQNQSTRDTLRAGKVLTVTVTTGSVGVSIPSAAINKTITESESFGYFDKDVTIELSAFSGSVASFEIGDTVPASNQVAILTPAQAARPDITGVVASTESGDLVGPDGQVFPSDYAYNNGNVATRIIAGRMMNVIDNTAAFTWELTVSLAEHADAVRWIFAQGRTGGTATSTPSFLANHYAGTSFADVDSATFATSVTFNGGSGTATMIAPTVDTTNDYLVSDWMPLTTVARTDGGVNPLVSCRAWLNGGTRLVLLGNGTDNFDNWSTRPVTERQHRIRRSTSGGNQASTSFTGALASNCPIIGVQYAARGRVYTIMCDGDSNQEGRDTYIGEGWILKAAEQINALNLGFKVETANCGFSGSATQQWRDSINNRYSKGIIPDLHFIQACSPNDLSAPITLTNLNLARQRVGQIRGRNLYKNEVLPFFINIAPSNFAVKAYGSSDSLRIDFNNELSASGLNVLDVSGVVSGPVDANGQVTILPAYNLDDIHFNKPGNTAIAERAVNLILKVLKFNKITA